MSDNITKPIRLELDGNWVLVRGRVPPMVLEEIRDMMRFQPVGYEYTDEYKENDWDGYINLFDPFRARFPYGFLDDVKMTLQIDNVEYEVVDRNRPFRDYPKPSTWTWNNGYKLHEYQNDAVSLALTMKRGIINLPTGTGKTIVACKIIHELNKSAVIFVHKKELMGQWVTSFETLLNHCPGRVGDGDANFGYITVAMVQTMSRLPKELLSEYEVTIFDECHHFPADSVYEIGMASHSPYIFGLSATPRREDGKELMLKGGIGPMIVTKTTSEMIYQGFLSKPTIYLVHMKPMGVERDYAKAYRKAIVDNEHRNAVIRSIVSKMELNKQIYIHVKHIRHGKVLAEMIPGSVFLCGSDKTEYRRETLDKFKSGELKILISTLLGEGVDIPNMDVLILACGGASETFVRQVIGRVLRITASKKEVTIYDFIDKVQFLYLHALKRIDVYKSEPQFVIKELN